jgi:hypothetical protein
LGREKGGKDRKNKNIFIKKGNDLGVGVIELGNKEAE